VASRTTWLKWFKIRLFEISSCIWISSYSNQRLLVLGWALILRTSLRWTFCRSRGLLLYNLRFKFFQRVLADNISINSSTGWFWLLVACVWAYCWRDLFTEDIYVCRRIVIFQNRLLLIVGSFKLAHGSLIINHARFISHVSHAVELRRLIEVSKWLFLFL